MQMTMPGTSDWRMWLLGIVVLTVCAGLAMHGPIAQDQAYHRFADGRELLGVSNAWNVLSNLPFLLFGAWGMMALFRYRALGAPLRAAFWIFFAGAALVSLGSAYYHFAPSDATLMWDRLPMTLAFMAFFAAVVSRHIASTFARYGLAPLLIVGLCSVLWWTFDGDLRPYLLVQFLPILLIPTILLLFPVRRPGAKCIWWVLAAYVSAKILEVFDAQIFEATGVGGHALKHVAASVGVYFVLRALRTGW